MRQEPQEEQGSDSAEVTMRNLPSTSQDQSSAIPSNYHECFAIHHPNKETGFREEAAYHLLP